MKKIIAILLSMLLPISTNLSIQAYSTAPSILSEASDMRIHEFLDEYDVSIPGGEDAFDYWLDFIRSTIAYVEQYGYTNSAYNWSIARDFSEAIEAAVLKYYGSVSKESLTCYSADNTIYTLQDSTPLSAWDNSYEGYNCYSYAVNRLNDWYVVGFSEGITGLYYLYYGCPNIEELDTWLLSDMASTEFGYNCVSKIEQVPTSSSVPIGATAICMRSCEYDFHFMVLKGSTWCHKPSGTIPLSWNYSSPDAKVWTNEHVDESGPHAGGVEYDSEIYYYIIREDHNYDTYYANQHRHRGQYHEYFVEEVCDNCGESYSHWIIRPCSGPPCALEYMGIPNHNYTE